MRNSRQAARGMALTSSAVLIIATTAIIAIIAGLAVTSPALALARGKAPTEPGKYKDWNGEIDELEIVQSFKLGDYQKVVLAEWDTSATPLPDTDDNTYEPVKKVLADPRSPLADGLREELPKRIGVEAAGQAPAAGPGTLLVRGRIETMDPGSKAARAFVGFGAGGARAALSGEVVDAATGQVLLRFKQERRSSTGWFGADYVKLMNRNLRTIGKDLAGALAAF